MILFTNKKDFQEHILIRSLIDIEYLTPYEEVAIRRKIYPFIPESVITDLKDNEPELYKLLKKAVAHYTIPIAIPMLKVTLTNAGISNPKDSELINAQWWDVRDMALNCAKIADETLTDLIDALLLTPYKSQLEFLDKFNNIIFKSPDEFYNIIQLNGGYDVFIRLLPSIENVWLTILQKQLPKCVFDNLQSHAALYDLIKKATAFYSIADALNSSAFVFTHSGIFIQWEQLPWQKSAVISPAEVLRLSESYYKKGNQMMQLIWDYLRENAAEFPCLDNFKTTERVVIIKKSGLYL